MIKRNDIKEFEFKLFSFYVELVYIKHFWNLRIIAINKKNRKYKTFYLLDI